MMLFIAKEDIPDIIATRAARWAGCGWLRRATAGWLAAAATLLRHFIYYYYYYSLPLLIYYGIINITYYY